ncbi:MAG: glycosyltransferase family 4 protein [Desulfobulbus sp.]|jgi:glycosyltransferase involved in cell wall biosynthesis
MRVAIVHYHLQSGGVTRIICHQAKALRALGVEVVILTGRSPLFDPGCPFRVVPALLYEADRPVVSPDELAARMRRTAAEALGAPPDLWHLHNHSLGKNLVLPMALRLLAERGESMLFQIHDFAEDGRAANFRLMLNKLAGGRQQVLSRILYPCGDRIHYAVLNRRDVRFMLAAGASGERLHLLPNPAALTPPPAKGRLPLRKPGRLWIYPTRAIRRKNLGEFLLWSALAPPDSCFAVTSGPENQLEQPRYHRWKQLAAELNLPVAFEWVGADKGTFVELLADADVAVTTSMAEGFGMAFLEPWLLDTPVCGRDLPEITDGIKEDGLVLHGAYTRLDVPLAWLGYDAVRRAAEIGLRDTFAAYGRGEPSGEDLARVMTAWLRDGHVDFGRLSEPLQEVVLQRVVRSRAQSGLIYPHIFASPATLRAPLAENRRILLDLYSLTRYGERLVRVYQRVLDAGPSRLDGHLDGGALLDRFLAPERLVLLRVD